MNKSISIIGGDKRIESLVRILEKDNYRIYTYGLEKADLSEHIIKCKSIKEAIENTSKVIGPIPIIFDEQIMKLDFSNEVIIIDELINNFSNKTFITGKIDENLKFKLEKRNNKIIDILENEEFTILNIIPTVEGAIQIAMENTTTVLHGMDALILGFGRIGKLLSKSLCGLGVKVTCEARKETDLAWIKAYGYEGFHINNLKNRINEYDIIFNTIPYKILDEEVLKKIKNNAIIIELASKPGGIDQNIAKKLNIKVVTALGLPGKVAPDTVAQNIYDILGSYNIV